MKSRLLSFVLSACSGAALVFGATSAASAAPSMYEPVAGSPFSVGDAPQGVAYDPVRNRLYVANALSDTVSILDATSLATIATVNSGGDNPLAIAVAPGGNSFYVLNHQDDEVVRISADAPYGVMASALTPDAPVDLAINPVTAHVYVVGLVSASLLEYSPDLSMDTIIPGPPASMSGVAVSPDGSTLVVAVRAGEFATFNTTTFAGVPRSLGAGSMGCVPVFVEYVGADRIAITCNGHDQVRVFETATWGLVGDPIEVGDEPWELTVAGNTAYVVNNADNTVSVVDIDAGTSVATIPVGVLPYGIAQMGGGDRLFVSNGAGDSVTVLDLVVAPEPEPTPTGEPTAPVTPTTTSGATLASTGVDAGPALLAGAAMLALAGASFAWVSMARRRSS